MSDFSLLRKVRRPSLPPLILSRPRLVDALHEAVQGTDTPSAENTSQYKLILLCAPAGYGKTTLLGDFARHTDLACCWCFLEPGDTDRTRVFQLLLSSIRQSFPQFGNTLDT